MDNAGDFAYVFEDLEIFFWIHENDHPWNNEETSWLKRVNEDICEGKLPYIQFAIKNGGMYLNNFKQVRRLVSIKFKLRSALRKLSFQNTQIICQNVVEYQ